MAFGAVFMLWFTYTMPIFFAFGVVSGKPQEMLSVPIQQLSRTMMYNKDELTDEVQKKIIAYIPAWGDYNLRLSDYVKSTFNKELFKEAPIDFFKLWAQVGASNVQAYVDAFMINTCGFWYPFAKNGLKASWPSWAYIEYDNTRMSEIFDGGYDLIRESKLPALDAFYTKYAKDAEWQSVHFIGALLSEGYCLWYLILAVLYALRIRKYRFIYFLVPMAGLFGTLLLGPIAIIRYAYPLMCVFPMLLLLFVKGENITITDERIKVWIK